MRRLELREVFRTLPDRRLIVAPPVLAPRDLLRVTALRPVREVAAVVRFRVDVLRLVALRPLVDALVVDALDRDLVREDVLRLFELVLDFRLGEAFFPPPSCLFTVAQALACAVFFETPRRS